MIPQKWHRQSHNKFHTRERFSGQPTAWPKFSGGAPSSLSHPARGALRAGAGHGLVSKFSRPLLPAAPYFTGSTLTDSEWQWLKVSWPTAAPWPRAFGIWLRWPHVIPPRFNRIYAGLTGSVQISTLSLSSSVACFALGAVSNAGGLTEAVQARDVRMLNGTGRNPSAGPPGR